VAYDINGMYDLDRFLCFVFHKG